MKIIIIILTAFFFISTSYTQVAQEWVSRYTGPGDNIDEDRFMALDNLGNVYVTGTSSVSQSRDYVTIKYNSTGVHQWIQIYNGLANADDVVFAIAMDKFGNVYVTGTSYTGGQTGWDCITIKYSSSGVVRWIQRFNGSSGAGFDLGYSIVIDDSANVYIAGWTQVPLGKDYLTIKYDSAGVLEWSKTYSGIGSGGYNETRSIVLEGTDYVYVTGTSSSSFSMATTDYATIKYKSSGTQLWVRRYNGPGNGSDEATKIALDGFGNIYVTGKSTGAGSGEDYTTIKYNYLGAEQWVSFYNGPGNSNDKVNSLVVDNSGNIYVTGYSGGSSSGTDYATIKYNPSGVEQWVSRYNG